MNLDSPPAEDIGDAPAIPGLAFRHFGGAADYPAMLVANNASKIADGLDYDLHTLDTLSKVYDNTPNYDPAQDLLIVEVDGQMVAYSRVMWVRELDGTLAYTHAGFVLPEWRGRGLGRALIGWAECRARTLAAVQPDAPAIYASADVHSNMAGLEHLLHNLGYVPMRYGFHMETPDLDHIPDVPLPAGFEVRPAQPEHYHAIWQASADRLVDSYVSL